MKKTITAIFGVAIVAPQVASAVTLGDTIDTVSKIINAVVPIILALAVLYFFWNLINYIKSAGDEGKRSAAIQGMIMGIIALFVMVSVWGIIAILQETFQVGGAAPIIPPTIPVNSSINSVPTRGILNVN